MAIVMIFLVVLPSLLVEVSGACDVKIRKTNKERERKTEKKFDATESINNHEALIAHSSFSRRREKSRVMSGTDKKRNNKIKKKKQKNALSQPLSLALTSCD